MLKKGYLFHTGTLVLAMGIYVMVGALRSDGTTGGLSQSLPSFLFPLACFSSVALLPRRLGGTSGQPLRALPVWVGTIFAIVIFEGAGPRFGLGTPDFLDAFALCLGSLLYSLLSFLAKRHRWG